jgi:hypothetical protein
MIYISPCRISDFQHWKLQVNKKLPQCLTNYAPRHEDVWGSGSISPPYLISEWIASRPCRFTPEGKSFQYPMDRRLGRPHSRSGSYRKCKNVASARNVTPVMQAVARRYTDWGIPTIDFQLNMPSATAMKRELKYGFLEFIMINT